MTIRLSQLGLAELGCINKKVRTNLDCVTILLPRLGLCKANRADGGMTIFRQKSVTLAATIAHDAHEKTTVGILW
jgi:hypothetical protein